jgi:hypothetical protein
MFSYTFIADYKGGTYVRQVSANSISEAFEKWAEKIIEQEEIPLKNKTTFLNSLQDDLAETPPACLENTPNVWYFLADAGKGFLHVHVVKTLAETSDWHPRNAGVLATDQEPGVVAAV